MVFSQTGISARAGWVWPPLTAAWEKMYFGMGWWGLTLIYLKLTAWDRHLWTARATRKGLGPLSEDSMQEEKQISQSGDCPGRCWVRRQKNLFFKTKHKCVPVVCAGGKAASLSRGIPLCELKRARCPGITQRGQKNYSNFRFIFRKKNNNKAKVVAEAPGNINSYFQRPPHHSTAEIKITA